MQDKINRNLPKEDNVSRLVSNDLLCIALIGKVLERAADECRGLQMFPTMPVSNEYRKGYNDGVCEAAEDILKLDSREILAEIKEDV